MTKNVLTLVASILLIFNASRALAQSYIFPLEGRLASTNGKPIDGPVALSVGFLQLAFDANGRLTHGLSVPFHAVRAWIFR